MAGRKILIITNRVPYPLNDGGNLAMQSMIDGYLYKGWQVYLLAMNTSKHYLPATLLKTLYTNLAGFEWMDVNNDIKPANVIRNFLFSKQAEHAERFYLPEFEHKIVDILANFKPDVVQVESVYLTTYMPAIKQHSRATTVLRLHNIEYHIWHSLSKKTHNFLKRRYLTDLTKRLKRFERDAWKQYDVVLAITEKDADHVIRLEDVPGLIVAPFGMDTRAIPVSTAEERWVGYHIAAMDWISNRESVEWFLAEVWPGLHATLPSFEFYFAGRKMPQEFARLNMEGVHCEMEVADAAAFIADKKILIVPIMSAGGIRVKILEAMAAGKIVITTPFGIKGIEAKAAEHYLSATSPNDFIRAVKWCLTNKDKAQVMADKARNLVLQHYDYRKITDHIADKIEQVETLKKL